MTEYEEGDEYCPHCDNHYVRASIGLVARGLTDAMVYDGQVIDAKTPQQMISVEGADARVDARCVSVCVTVQFAYSRIASQNDQRRTRGTEETQTFRLS